METKSGNIDAAPHTHPSADPPPYPGPPGPGPMPGPGPSYPVYPGQPVITQPHVTVVPGSTTYIQGGTVIPAVVIAHGMGPEPTPYVCRSCNQRIVTRVERIPSLRTHLFAALLCIVGLWPCVCIPYCVDSCMNTDHYCPNCNAYIGSYNS